MQDLERQPVPVCPGVAGRAIRGLFGHQPLIISGMASSHVERPLPLLHASASAEGHGWRKCEIFPPFQFHRSSSFAPDATGAVEVSHLAH